MALSPGVGFLCHNYTTTSCHDLLDILSPFSSYLDNQSLLQGVPSQLGIILEIHLVQDSRSIRADRRDTEMNAFGDIADRLP